MYYVTGHGSFADTKPAITHIYDIAQEKDRSWINR